MNNKEIKTEFIPQVIPDGDLSNKRIKQLIELGREDDKLDYKEKYDFTGKVAVVTGSAGGIGKAIAVNLVRNGATVVVSDIQVDNGQKTVDGLWAWVGKKSGDGAAKIAMKLSKQLAQNNLDAAESLKNMKNQRC